MMGARPNLYLLLATRGALIEDSDQTVQMRRLIWVYDGRTS